MANNSWTTARVLNGARDFDRISREINNTVNQAQGWNPRAWIQITDIQVAGRDVLFKLQTDWQNGDRVAAAVAEALDMTVKGSFSGECDPPKGTFTFGAQAARSKPSRCGTPTWASACRHPARDTGPNTAPSTWHLQRTASSTLAAWPPHCRAST